MPFRSRHDDGRVFKTRRSGGQWEQEPRSRSSGTLTSKQRSRLPDRDFAVILKDGTRKYPIQDESHARNALARVSANGSPEEKAEVRRKVHERYPSIDSDRPPKIQGEYASKRDYPRRTGAIVAYQGKRYRLERRAAGDDWFAVEYPNRDHVRQIPDSELKGKVEYFV